MIVVQALSLVQLQDQYFYERLLFEPQQVSSISDRFQRALDSRAGMAVTHVVSHFIIACVKLSFLFLFRKLIDRVPYMRAYWWFAMTFNVVNSIAGFAIPFIIYPCYSTPASLEGASGAAGCFARAFTALQCVLDAVADLLILYMPLSLIQKIRVDMRQRIALSCSLSLTVGLIATTLVRPAGLLDEKVHVVWPAFWTCVAGHIGVLLASLTTFRALFVQRAASPGLSPRPRFRPNWYRLNQRLCGLLHPRHSKGAPFMQPSRERSFDREGEIPSLLPSLPQPALAGTPTFIAGSSRTANLSRVARSEWTELERRYTDDDPWLLPNARRKVWECDDLEQRLGGGRYLAPGSG